MITTTFLLKEITINNLLKHKKQKKRLTCVLVHADQAIIVIGAVVASNIVSIFRCHCFLERNRFKSAASFTISLKSIVFIARIKDSIDRETNVLFWADLSHTALETHELARKLKRIWLAF